MKSIITIKELKQKLPKNIRENHYILQFLSKYFYDSVAGYTWKENGTLRFKIEKPNRNLIFSMTKKKDIFLKVSQTMNTMMNNKITSVHMININPYENGDFRMITRKVEGVSSKEQTSNYTRLQSKEERNYSKDGSLIRKSYSLYFIENDAKEVMNWHSSLACYSSLDSYYFKDRDGNDKALLKKEEVGKKTEYYVCTMIHGKEVAKERISKERFEEYFAKEISFEMVPAMMKIKKKSLRK